MPIPEAMRRFLAICHPDCTIDRLPIWLAKASAILTFNTNLKMAVKLMGFFDKHDDSEVTVGPEEAQSIFGPLHTSVEQWSKAYKKVVIGAE
jgi:hypothetical protein